MKSAVRCLADGCKTRIPNVDSRSSNSLPRFIAAPELLQFFCFHLFFYPHSPMTHLNLPLTALLTVALTAPTLPARAQAPDSGPNTSSATKQTAPKDLEGAASPAVHPPALPAAPEALRPLSQGRSAVRPAVRQHSTPLPVASSVPPTTAVAVEQQGRSPAFPALLASTATPTTAAAETGAIAQANETAQLREQIRLLEERQRSMEQEFQQRQQELERQIEALRQQVTGPSPTDPSTAAPVATTPTAPRRQSVEPSLSVMFLDPATSNLLDFALVDPGIALTAGGTVATVDLEEDTALRYGLTYRFANSALELGVDHVSLSSSGSASATRPPNGFLFATLANPAQNERADTASANASIDSSVTNVELGYRLPAGRDLEIRLFTGLRFADLNQDLQVRYDGEDFTNTLINIERGFSGGGLRLGGQANWNIGAGFSLYGRAAGSLLVGDISINQSEVDNNGLDQIASLQSRETRIVPMLELTAGLDWTANLSNASRLTIGAGYTLENWFNATDSIRFVDSASAGVFTQDSSDLSWEGFFLKFALELEF